MYLPFWWPKNYLFSADEMRVLSECEIEAMFKRCIPMGFAAGFGAFIGVQKGFLKVSRSNQCRLSANVNMFYVKKKIAGQSKIRCSTKNYRFLSSWLYIWSTQLSECLHWKADEFAGLKVCRNDTSTQKHRVQRWFMEVYNHDQHGSRCSDSTLIGTISVIWFWTASAFT